MWKSALLYYCMVTCVPEHLWRLKSKHCVNCIYIYNTSTNITESRQSSDEKQEKRQRRLKSEVNEDVCYVDEKLISPGGSAGLSLPFLCLLSSIKLWIVSCSVRGRQWNSHAHTLKHMRQDVEKPGRLNKTLAVWFLLKRGGEQNFKLHIPEGSLFVFKHIILGKILSMWFHWEQKTFCTGIPSL